MEQSATISSQSVCLSEPSVLDLVQKENEMECLQSLQKTQNLLELSTGESSKIFPLDSYDSSALFSHRAMLFLQLRRQGQN